MIREPMERADTRSPEPMLRTPEMAVWPLGDLDVVAVTEHGWRVTDRTLSRRDPARLLGFIERRDEHYEVLQLGVGFEWHEFGSLDAALAFVITTAPAMVRKRRDAAPS